MNLYQFTAYYCEEKPGVPVAVLESRDELARKFASLYRFLSNEEHPQLWFPGPSAYANVWPSYHTVSRSLRDDKVWKLRVPMPAPPGVKRYVDLCIRERMCF